MLRNVPLFLRNVRDFEVRGIRFINSRYWCTTFMFCRWGKITDLDFRLYGTLENQDGIDLRIGCEYITIENITGITGDDTVALTALPSKKDQAVGSLTVKGKPIDIHGITIHNVISASYGNHLLRFLCEDGAKIYDVTAEGLKDTGKAISGSAIIFGTTDPYLMETPHKMGDLRNITVRDVVSHSQRALGLCEPCENLLIENVVADTGTEMEIRLRHNFHAKNVIIRNFVLRSGDTADSFADTECPPEVVADLRLENVRIENINYLFREIALKAGAHIGRSERTHSDRRARPPCKRLRTLFPRSVQKSHSKSPEGRPFSKREALTDSRFCATIKRKYKAEQTDTAGPPAFYRFVQKSLLHF